VQNRIGWPFSGFALSIKRQKTAILLIVQKPFADTSYLLRNRRKVQVGKRQRDVIKNYIIFNDKLISIYSMLYIEK